MALTAISSMLLQLQEELDQCRLQVKLTLGRFRGAKAATKRGAFAKVDVEDALLKTTRDPSKSLGLVVNKKKRKAITAIGNAEAVDSSSIE
jgi:hypothetical protein